MDWAHQRRARNLFTYDWCSAPTASATSRDYSQGNVHRCHSTTYGICVPSLEWRTNSKPTTTTRFILQLERHGIRLPPLQTRFDYHSLVVLYKMRSSLAPPYLCSLLPRQASATTGYSFRKSGYPVPAIRKSSTLSSFVPRAIVLWIALPKEIQESNMLTKFKTRLRTDLHIWCQQSHSLNSRWSALLLIFLINS